MGELPLATFDPDLQLICKPTHLDCWITHHDRVRLDRAAQDTTCTDEHVVADYCSWQEYGVHADEDIVADLHGSSYRDVRRQHAIVRDQSSGYEVVVRQQDDVA